MRIVGGTVLTMRPGDEPHVGDVCIEGDRIASTAGGETIDASGCFVLPGLVQTHVHLAQTLFRGLAEDRALLEWLRERIWPLEAAHDEPSLRASARLGLLELLRTGTTTILDMGTTHGTDVIAAELVRSGIRARFGKAMMDTGDGVPVRLRERTGASLDEADDLRARWSGAGEGRIGYAYAPRFALSCSRDLLEGVAARVRETGALLHTHSNENRDEGAAVRAATGLAPAAYLAAVGLATERSVFAHGVHLEEAELALLAERHVAIAHCPSSNLKLASGIADVVRLRARGVTVGIGADGAACNNRLDAFEEARLAVLLSRSLHGPRALGALDGLALATRDGARALRLDGEIGTLEPGKRADVVVLDGAKLAGPGGDPATRILFGGGSRAVRDVVVAGRVLVRDGVGLTLDDAEVAARAAEAVPPLLERAGLG